MLKMRNLKGELYINSCDSSGNQIQETNLEKAHWFKEFEFSGIFGIETFYEPVSIDGKPSTKLKSYQAYSFKRFKLRAGACKQCRDLLDLGIIKESGCRVRKGLSIKTGAYIRCFTGTKNGDITQHFMNWDDKKHWTLLEEKPVSVDDCIKLFNEHRLDYIASWDLIKILEERLSVNL